MKQSNLHASAQLTALRFLLVFAALSLYFTGVSQVSVVYQIDGLAAITKREKKSFKDSISMSAYFNDLRFEAYRRGFLTFSLDKITQTDSLNFLVEGTAGLPFKKIELIISPENKKLLRKIGIQPKTMGYVRANPFDIARLLKETLSTLENNGYPFAKVGLNTLEMEGDFISTELFIEPNAEVNWTKIHIIGERTGVSEKFMSNYLHIGIGDPFSQENINLISTRLKQITYLSQKKPPELLFTPEGAELYLYLESKPVSLFNGTVGLQQNPVTLSYQLTGDLRLKLQNVLRKGELFDLNWRSIQPGSPQLKLMLSYPYLFNTPFGVEGSFQLFKRDSTFLELNSSIGVNYFLSAGNTLKAFYKNYSSALLGSTLSTGSYGTVKSNQYGLALTHQTIDYLPNPTRGLLWTVEGSAGQRNVTKDTVTAKSLVFTGRLRIEAYLPLAKRHILKLASVSETYSADNIQQNELMRFGGNLSQRGFLEDELLSSTRTTQTVEYRFLLDRNSFLFAFFDQSWYERNVTQYLNDHPMGFGAGLSFGTNVGIFSLTYAIGQQQGNPILLRDSKVHFGYIAYF